jgi:hypothetical protein
MRHFSDEIFGEENKHFVVETHFLLKQNLYSINFFENCFVYQIVWKSVAEPGWPQMTVGYGACVLCAE